MLKEVTKNPKMSRQDLQQALATVDVKVHDYFQKLQFDGTRRQPLLSKKNIMAKLKFARVCGQNYWLLE